MPTRGSVAIFLCLAPLSAIAQETGESAARPIGNLAEWFPKSSMPAESVVRGETGAVILQLDIDAEGKVTACKFTESSGFPSLDEAACDRARRFGHFKPAVNAKGNPIPSVFTLPRLRYVLSTAKLSATLVDGGKRQVYNSTIQLEVDKLGAIKACHSLNKDASDAKACVGYEVGKAAPEGFKTESGSKVTISHTIVVDRDGDN